LHVFLFRNEAAPTRRACGFDSSVIILMPTELRRSPLAESLENERKI
jgi:hypothetical protein